MSVHTDAVTVGRYLVPVFNHTSTLRTHKTHYSHFYNIAIMWVLTLVPVLTLVKSHYYYYSILILNSQI